MKTKRKYDKETLNQYDWIKLFRLQCKIGDRKMMPFAIILFFLSIANFFIREPLWLKWSIKGVIIILMIWLAVWMVRFFRIERIMDEK